MSSYSPNLALELITTGDQAGTWGNTTNTNLGTLIEQAISGYVTQTMSDAGDTAITIPNGAYGVARNMYLELTGSLSAIRNLIIPSNKKLYYIYNNTTGGFAVTVKVSGQTGITVQNGAKIALVCNGTDAALATNSFGIAGTVNTVSYFNATGVLASATNLTYNATGNVSISAPSSGAALTVTGVASNPAIQANPASGAAGIKITGNTTGALINLTDGNTGSRVWIVANGTTYAGQSAGTFAIYDNTSGITPLQIAGATGNITLNAPTTGTTLTVTGQTSAIAAQINHGSADIGLRLSNGSGNLDFYASGGSSYINVPGAWGLDLKTNSVSRVSISSTGTATVNATTTGVPALVINGSAATPPNAVTFSATAMVIDCTRSNVFTTTFTANVTTAPTVDNPQDGQSINWFITQDGTGSRTIVWPSSFKWPASTPGVLSTAANSVDLLVATYRASTGFWYCNLQKAFG